MKYMKYTLTLICILQLSGCRETVTPDKLNNDIDSIALSWIPVPEEGVSTFSLEPASGNNYILKGETNNQKAKNAIVEYLNISGISFIDSLLILPDPAIVTSPWGLVTLSVCNMRSKPSHDAELVTQAIMGTPVKILDKEDGWLLVQTPDSYVGWSDDAAISEFSDNDLNEWKKSDRIICNTNYGIISDEDGNVVSDLVYGSVLRTTEEKDGYYNIVLPDGRKGRIAKIIAKDFSVWADCGSPQPDDMISFARTLVGTPYLWGGTSTKGVDCSGFVKTIYFTQGVILTRDASSQYMYGTEVPIENSWELLEPGDLLFFGRMRDGRKRITHTGMYIGNTEVIHSSGLVRINSLNPERENYSEYLAKNLLGAKRFIGAPAGLGNMPVAKHNWYF